MSSNERNDSAATAAVPEGGYTATAQERIQELRLWREQIPYALTYLLTNAYASAR